MVRFVRILTVILFVSLSFGMHYFLFHENNQGYIETIFNKPYMHFLYFIFSLLFGEHFLKKITKGT